MNLKERLEEHYQENRADFDPEETDNVLEVLKDCKDDLSGVSRWDLLILVRLINNDKELMNELEEILDDLTMKEIEEDDDPFA